MKDTISVAGRNPHPIIRPCRTEDEASRVAAEMVAAGYQNVTIDGEPANKWEPSSNGANE